MTHDVDRIALLHGLPPWNASLHDATTNMRARMRTHHRPTDSSFEQLESFLEKASPKQLRHKVRDLSVQLERESAVKRSLAHALHEQSLVSAKTAREHRQASQAQLARVEKEKERLSLELQQVRRSFQQAQDDMASLRSNMATSSSNLRMKMANLQQEFITLLTSSDAPPKQAGDHHHLFLHWQLYKAAQDGHGGFKTPYVDLFESSPWLRHFPYACATRHRSKPRPLKLSTIQPSFSSSPRHVSSKRKLTPLHVTKSPSVSQWTPLLDSHSPFSSSMK